MLLEEITEDTDDEGIWCYFDQDGKLVKDQIDRKIDGFYYTFKDGQMQTGWVKVSDTAGGSSDGEEGGSSASNPLADYRYYDKELGGKRASGWYVIEGVEGITRRARNTTSTLRTENPTTLRPKVWNSSISIPSAMPLMEKRRDADGTSETHN